MPTNYTNTHKNEFGSFLTLKNPRYNAINTIKLDAICAKVLNSYKNMLTLDLKQKGIEYKLVHLPTKVEKFTYLRSPFVHKKTKEQQARKYYSIILQLNAKNDEKGEQKCYTQGELQIPFSTKACTITFVYSGV